MRMQSNKYNRLMYTGIYLFLNDFSPLQKEIKMETESNLLPSVCHPPIGGIENMRP